VAAVAAAAAAAAAAATATATVQKFLSSLLGLPRPPWRLRPPALTSAAVASASIVEAASAAA